jgi:hypothetical protein
MRLVVVEWWWWWWITSSDYYHRYEKMSNTFPEGDTHVALGMKMFYIHIAFTTAQHWHVQQAGFSLLP